ncbi:MAG: HvfC/BufC family peptide modification chaperone [Polyangia bacterium]
MPALRDTQQLFWSLITAPEGVGDGLRRLDMKSDDLARVVSGDERLDAVQRLDIYANMYFWRLLDILRGDYSAVVACVGDDPFHNLVTDYLLACPSSHPSVRNVGARLPDFLARQPLAAERPWLVELARLERARIELFDGPDAAPLTLDELRALAPDDFVALPLPLVPSHLLLEVEHAVDDVWRAVENEQPVEPPEPGARTLLAWRPDITVYHRPLEPLERRALLRARDGASFGVVCELLAESMTMEEAGPAAFQLLARWVGDGIIARP